MPEESTARRERKKTVQHMVVVGVIASALGIALGLAIRWFPPADATQAGPIDTLWDVLVIASVPIFVLVAVIVGFAVLEFRMRPGEENLDGPPIHGNTRLEVIWTALPALLVVGLVTYAYIVLEDIEKAPAQTPERVVKVVGEQFAWTFQYDEGGKRFSTTRAYLPVDESVKFDVQAKDVIHSFWIPDFRMKIDAVPGITTNIRVTPKGQGSLGNHEVVCAELCGLGHAYMRSTVTVVSRGDYDAWVRRMTTRPGAGGGGGDAQANVDPKQLFNAGDTTTGATACGTCHALADAGTTAQTGPNLDEVLKGKDAAYIREAIVSPDQQVTSGFQPGIMPPNYGDTLSEQQIDALVEYLSKVTNK